MSLSAMERFAVNEPVTVGAKVTPILHELPDATLAGQSVVTRNGAEVVWLVMLSAELPVLVRVVVKVRVGGGTVGVIFNVPKFRLPGMSLTVPGVSVMLAVAVLVVSVTDVAVRVTVGLVGTVAGAA